MNKKGIAPIVAILLMILLLVFTTFLVLNVQNSSIQEQDLLNNIHNNTCEETLNSVLAVLEEMRDKGEISEEAYEKIVKRIS